MERLGTHSDINSTMHVSMQYNDTRVYDVSTINPAFTFNMFICFQLNVFLARSLVTQRYINQTIILFIYKQCKQLLVNIVYLGLMDVVKLCIL
jgi:hypothetical protein